MYKGRHEAIIEESLWHQAQDILKQRPLKAPAERRSFDFALKIKIRCQECQKAMIATFRTKKHKKYPYYTCLNKNKGMPCHGLDRNMDAELVLRLVTAEVRKILKEPEILGGLWEKLSEQASPEKSYKKLQHCDEVWEELTPEEKDKIIQKLVKTVWLSQQGITIEFSAQGESPAAETSKVVAILGHFYHRLNKPQVFVKKEEPEEIKDPVLLKALIQAELWQQKLDEGVYVTHEEIAQAYGYDKEYVQRGLFLAALSPRIKSAILQGKLSPRWTLQDFKRKRPPLDWREQEAVFLGEVEYPE